jgi:hypothetical protein
MRAAAVMMRRSYALSTPASFAGRLRPQLRQQRRSRWQSRSANSAPSPALLSPPSLRAPPHRPGAGGDSDRFSPRAPSTTHLLWSCCTHRGRALPPCAASLGRAAPPVYPITRLTRIYRALAGREPCSGVWRTDTTCHYMHRGKSARWSLLPSGRTSVTRHGPACRWHAPAWARNGSDSD